MGEGIKIAGINTNSSRGLTPRSGQQESAMFRRERERHAAQRLAAKQDINRGLTPAQLKAVEKFENDHRYRKTERIVAIGKDGRILGQSKSGSESSTALPIGNYKDAVITHNHPGTVHGDATRYGISLSLADIRSAVVYDAAEVRAVGGSYTYSLRRPRGGWSANMRNFLGEWRSKWNAMKPEMQKYHDAGKDFQDKIRRAQRVNTLGAHRINKELTAKYGLEYTRKKTR